MNIHSILPSLNRISDEGSQTVSLSPLDGTSAYKHGDYFSFRLNINHISEGFDHRFVENPIRRMVMTGRFDYERVGNTTIRDVGVWYDETTGRYFAYFYFDLECRMYRLRRTDEIET